MPKSTPRTSASQQRASLSENCSLRGFKLAIANLGGATRTRCALPAGVARVHDHVYSVITACVNAQACWGEAGCAASQADESRGTTFRREKNPGRETPRHQPHAVRDLDHDEDEKYISAIIVMMIIMEGGGGYRMGRCTATALTGRLGRRRRSEGRTLHVASHYTTPHHTHTLLPNERKRHCSTHGAISSNNVQAWHPHFVNTGCCLLHQQNTPKTDNEYSQRSREVVRGGLSGQRTDHNAHTQSTIPCYCITG
jgi:hypothetical protein